MKIIMKRSISEVDLLTKETKDELKLLRDEQQKVEEAHVAHIKVLEKKLFDSRRTFARFGRNNSVRLHTYSVAIQEVRSGERHSRNIVSMEGQVCQAIHQMNMQANQLEIIQNAAAGIQADYQMSHDEVLRGKQMGEHILMKAIVELDDLKMEEEQHLMKRKIEQEENMNYLKRELQERFPLLFLPELDEEDEEKPKEEAENDKATRGQSFFKAAQRLTFALNMGGNPQSHKEEDAQGNRTIAMPSFAKKKHDELLSSVKCEGDVRKRGSSLAFVAENRSLNHMMAHTTISL